MTIIQNLHHLNLNTGGKTCVDVLFADWLNVRRVVQQRSRNIVDDLTMQVEWEPGAALVRFVDQEDALVSVHAVAVTDAAADIIWQIIEGIWFQEAEKNPSLYDQNEAYPDLQEMKLPWVASLYGAAWYRMHDARQKKHYNHAGLMAGAMYRELKERGKQK